jgi:regulator of nucleoside diphosphate kinase
MKAENIVITEADYMRLQRLVASSRLFGQRDAKHLDHLAQELERAAIMKAGEVPSDVVTMNSRVRVKDLNR